MIRQDLHIGIAGNCQVNALESWLRLNLPAANVSKLPPYHQLKDDEEVRCWLKNCKHADHVLAIPVRDGYGGMDSVGSNRFQDVFGRRLHFYPNVYNDSFFPFFGYAKTRAGTTITDAEYPGNQYGDYQDFLAMAVHQARLPWGRLMRLRMMLAMQQKSFIIANARNSIQELSSRLTAMRSSLAGEAIAVETLCGYTFNHPHSSFLNQLYFSIWTKILGGSKDDFQPLATEPFEAGNALPIPAFVHRALCAGFPALAHAPMPREICNADQYEELLKRSLLYYSRHDWIPEHNRQHQKFKAARRYLRGLSWIDAQSKD